MGEGSPQHPNNDNIAKTPAELEARFAASNEAVGPEAENVAAGKEVSDVDRFETERGLEDLDDLESSARRADSAGDIPDGPPRPNLTAMAAGEKPEPQEPSSDNKPLAVGNYDQFEDGTLDAHQEAAHAASERQPDNISLSEAAKTAWSTADPSLHPQEQQPEKEEE